MKLREDTEWHLFQPWRDLPRILEFDPPTQLLGSLAGSKLCTGSWECKPTEAVGWHLVYLPSVADEQEELAKLGKLVGL